MEYMASRPYYSCYIRMFHFLYMLCTVMQLWHVVQPDKTYPKHSGYSTAVPFHLAAELQADSGRFDDVQHGWVSEVYIKSAFPIDGKRKKVLSSIELLQRIIGNIKGAGSAKESFSLPRIFLYAILKPSGFPIAWINSLCVILASYPLVTVNRYSKKTWLDYSLQGLCT